MQLFPLRISGEDKAGTIFGESVGVVWRSEALSSERCDAAVEMFVEGVMEGAVEVSNEETPFLTRIGVSTGLIAEGDILIV